MWVIDNHETYEKQIVATREELNTLIESGKIDLRWDKPVPMPRYQEITLPDRAVTIDNYVMFNGKTEKQARRDVAHYVVQYMQEDYKVSCVGRTNFLRRRYGSGTEIIRVDYINYLHVIAHKIELTSELAYVYPKNCIIRCESGEIFTGNSLEDALSRVPKWGSFEVNPPSLQKVMCADTNSIVDIPADDWVYEIEDWSYYADLLYAERGSLDKSLKVMYGGKLVASYPNYASIDTDMTLDESLRYYIAEGEESYNELAHRYDMTHNQLIKLESTMDELLSDRLLYIKNILKEDYPSGDIYEIAEHLGIYPETVQSYASQFGIKRAGPAFIPYEGDGVDKYIIDNYTTMLKVDIAKELGMSTSWLRTRARRLGLL